MRLERAVSERAGHRNRRLNWHDYPPPGFLLRTEALSSARSSSRQPEPEMGAPLGGGEPNRVQELQDLRGVVGKVEVFARGWPDFWPF